MSHHAMKRRWATISDTQLEFFLGDKVMDVAYHGFQCDYICSMGHKAYTLKMACKLVDVISG